MLVLKIGVVLTWLAAVGVCLRTDSADNRNNVDDLQQKRFLLALAGNTMWSPWTAYSACSATCGSGYKSRSRFCMNAKDYSKVDSISCSGADFESVGCYKSCINTPHVQSVDGAWGTWAVTSPCSKTCGDGQMTRSRVCNNPAPSSGGKDCAGIQFIFSTCHIRDCPTMTPAPTGWGPWSAPTCSVTCGSGLETRKRTCQNPPGGPPCRGSGSEMHGCYAGSCPVNGQWGAWSSYSACSETCGEGKQIRTRSCNNPAPTPGGLSCPGNNQQHVTCTERPCAVDGNWSPWTSWSTCSSTCDLGQLVRIRSCSHPAPRYGGANCTGQPMESHDCSRGPCPSWTHWFEMPCSVTCGNGTLERLRHCSTGLDADCSGHAYEIVPCVKSGCK